MTADDRKRVSGRDNASALVLETHRRRFLRFLARRTGDSHTAEDLLQEVMTRAVRQDAQERQTPADVTAWAYRVIRNVLVDYYRKRDAARRATERVALDSDVQGQTPPGETKTLCRCVNAAAAALTDDQAWWVGQVDVEGRSVADASRERGLSPGAGRVRLHRARVALRRRVEAACGRCAEDGCADCTCRASET